MKARKHKICGDASVRDLLSLAAVMLTVTAAPSLAFVEKEFVAPLLEMPAKGTRSNVEAARLVYDPTTGQAEATGRVELTYGPYTLTASKVRYNRKTGAFSANGSVVVREPNGNVVMASAASFKNQFRDGFARHLKALLTNDATVKAKYVRRAQGKFTVYEQVSYTACKDCKTKSGDPLWEVVTDETQHDEKGHTLYHRNPRLRVNGVTVLGLPYLEHPDPTVKRRSGWLAPDVRTGSAYTVGVVTPYFWAPADDYDVTFRPMWTVSQGPVADVEFRKKTATGLYSIRAAGVHQFKDLPPPRDDTWRGAVRAQGDFQPNEDWRWGFDGTLASDRNFLSDYDIDDREVAMNQVYATGLWDRSFIDVRALNFAPLNTDISSDVLPTAAPFIVGDHGFSHDSFGEFGLAWSAYSISRDRAYSPFNTVNLGTSQSRGIANFRWQNQFVMQGGQVITPFARLRSDIYVTNNIPDPASLSGFREGEVTSRILPAVGFDARWPMVNSSDFGQSIFSPVLQVIAASNETKEDRIGNEDAVTLNFDHTSLFLEDRFTGADRYEGGTRINAGLTYSLLGDNGGFVRASMGESFHLAGENSFVDGSGLSGSQSDLVGAITFQPWQELGFSYEIRGEENLSDINKQEATLNLAFEDISGTFAYRDIEAAPNYGLLTPLHEISGNARVGLNDSWYLLTSANYDLNTNTLREVGGGFEFDCNCMNFKATYTYSKPNTDNEIDHRLMFSIDLATLGGTKVSTKF